MLFEPFMWVLLHGCVRVCVCVCVEFCILLTYVRTCVFVAVYRFLSAHVSVRRQLDDWLAVCPIARTIAPARVSLLKCGYGLACSLFNLSSFFDS